MLPLLASVVLQVPPVQVSIRVRTYEVSSRFSISETRTERLKSGETYGAVKTEVFALSLAKLVENRRAKEVSAPIIRTLSGQAATFGVAQNGRDEETEFIPTVGEKGVLLSVRRLADKVEKFAFKVSLRPDESLALVWKSGRQTMLTTATCAVIAD